MSPPHKRISSSGQSNWSRLEQIIERFEEGWLRGQPPDIDEYLRAEDVEPHSLVVELVHTDLECRLKAGEPARVETYFERYKDLTTDPEQALALIAAEYEMRRRREPGLQLDEYLRRFPEYSGELLSRLRCSARSSGQPPLLTSCPRCHNPIDPVKGTTSSQICCPSCGSSFRLDSAHPSAWSPEKLTSLGKFELLEAVGRGAFGTVYRARDRELDRIVAVKVPRGSQWISQGDVDRFVREGRNAARLSHPGIVSVHEAGQRDALPYIVTAFVEGQTLAQAQASRRFGFHEAADIVAQVAEALEHAHCHGVIHRDLKPSNIMLGHLHGAQPGEGEATSLRAFVTDFGLAWRDEGDVTITVEGQILGTPAYMSPEQARGRSHQVDGRSDVYSLGVVLYELLTGEVPFRGVTRMVLQQILHEEPRPPRQLNDKVSRDLETIALKCLAKESGRRYATAGELAADLRRHLKGEPIRARPVGTLERAWRWARRNPRVAGLSATVGILLLVLAVGGTVASIVFNHQRNAEAEARREAVVAQQQAEKNEALARTAQQQAEQSSTLANQQRDVTLETLLKLLKEVQPQLADRPGLQKVREKVLNIVLASLEGVAPGNDLRSDHYTFNVHKLLGELQLTMGRTIEAQQQFERSRAVAEKMVAENPQNVLVQHQLAVSFVNLGVVSLRTGDAAAARTHLEKAVELHEEVLDKDSKSLLYQRSLMVAYNRLADDYLELGEVVQAQEIVAKGKKLAERLVAADSKNLEYLGDLGHSCERMGHVCSRLGDAAAALDYHRQALEQRERVAKLDPDSVFARRRLMVSCLGIGDLYLKKSEVALAEAMYRKAHDQCRQMAKLDPQSFKVREDLASCCEKLGDLRLRLFDYPNALAYYREGVQRREELWSADPQNAVIRRALSVAHEKLGQTSRRLGDQSTARLHYGKALEHRQALASANRESVQAQAELAAAQGNVAAVEMDAGDFARAVQHYERGLGIMQQLEARGRIKDQPQYQGWLHSFQSRLAISKAAERAVEDLDFALKQPKEQVAELLLIRARVLAGKGRHVDAAATAERLRTLAPGNVVNLYNVGCSYAWCVRGVGPGKGLDQLTAEEAAARMEYTQRAVDALSEAVKNGYKNAGQLKTDHQLTSIRKNEGYQKLVEQLTAAPR